MATESSQPPQHDPADRSARQTFSHYPAIPSPTPHSLTVVEPCPCVYLPGRTMRTRGIWASRIDDEAMQAFLDAGFRRSGHVLYQPVCAGCRACVPLRIEAATFRMSRSQTRIWRRNADLKLSVDRPVLTEEKQALYELYLGQQHRRTGEEEPGALEGFLYQSPATTLEVEYRTPDGQLVGVGICDVTPEVLSAVYFFWHPDFARRSLGTYSSLREIELATRLNRRWYHLGYWVDVSPAMAYKASIGDHEILGTDGIWRRQKRK